ncbi:uncharacterized protein [Typha latifolia]|uniref:uncharacterized protein n=1 Tax=Typha latifolia TaxID=4733 RepID=UPI003C2E8E0B
MNGRDPGDEAAGSRRVLGDVTNILGKRPLSLDLEVPITENKIGRYQGSLSCADTVSKSEFYRKVEAIMKGKEKVAPLSVISDNDSQCKGKHSFADANQQFLDCLSGLGDKVRESVPESEEDCEEDYETDSGDSLRCGVQGERDNSSLDFLGKLEDKMEAECLTQDPMGKSGILGFLKPSGSLGLKMVDGQGSLNVNADLNSENMEEEGSNDSHKSCKCSFCLKAAYMWTDLHYQDTRGRLAALKRSRRFARLLEGKSYGLEYTAKAPRSSLKQSAEMEFELVQHWRSLFLHTENVLVRETAQLHSSLLRLKDLRENCKKDLEMISTISLDK